MKCPYCQGEMQRGTLSGDGRSAVYFQQEGKKLTFSDKLCGIGRVMTKRSLTRFLIEADYCEKCKKVIFDAEIGKEKKAPGPTRLRGFAYSQSKIAFFSISAPYSSFQRWWASQSS